MSLFICCHCGSERKNHNSWRNHERLCKKNENRQKTIFADVDFQKKNNNNNNKNRENQYTKAKKLGLPKPNISDETRKKISVKARINNLKRDVSVNEKISESMKKAHAEGRAWNIGKSRWNNKPSYPEQFFMEVIENEFFDKNYINEHPIGIYSADFCWPHLKKIIEIDGEQHQRFEDYMKRDEKKDEYLKSQGYEILRIVWKDMFADPKTKIMEAYNFIH